MVNQVKNPRLPDGQENSKSQSENCNHERYLFEFSLVTFDFGIIIPPHFRYERCSYTIACCSLTTASINIFYWLVLR